MILGFHSPLPPARTGVADYSAALLRAMRENAPQGWRIEANRGGDLNLYHLGNNGLHRSIYARALAEPGIIVLHDAVLQHFLLGALAESEYVAEFAYNYGTWHTDLARRLWAGRAKSAAEAIYFEYPLLRRAVECARLVIVHNRRAGDLARRHGAAAVRVIPHLFEGAPAAPAYQIVRLRERLGVGGADPLFGVFGHLRESKRVAAVLRAFARVHAEYPGAKLRSGRRILVERSGAEHDEAIAGRHLDGLSGASRFLPARRRRRCVHQPALAFGRRDLRHRHTPDGHGKMRCWSPPARKRPGSRMTPASALTPDRPRKKC